MRLSDFEVHLLGCGQMGTALIRGAVESGVLNPERLFCHDRDGARSATLALMLGAAAFEGYFAYPAAGPRMFVVAVKPQDVAMALREIPFEEGDVVVSVAAGVTLGQLSQACAPAQVVRSMPNTPSLVGKGVTGIFSQEPCPAAVALFESVGVVVELTDEKHFDALTAVSGCGPAYVFLVLEALADGAVMMGLDRATARKIAAATLEGAAHFAAASEEHTAELKDRVASPGGVTIAALAHLEERGVRSAFIGAVEIAARRSRQR